MTRPDGPDGLEMWIEASQACVEGWVRAQEPDVSDIAQSVDAHAAAELTAWIGDGPVLETPVPDVADLERRLRPDAGAPSVVAPAVNVDSGRDDGTDDGIDDEIVADAVAQTQLVVERRVRERSAQRQPGAASTEHSVDVRWRWVAAAVLCAACAVMLLWAGADRLDPWEERSRLQQAAQVAIEPGDDLVSEAQPNTSVRRSVDGVSSAPEAPPVASTERLVPEADGGEPELSPARTGAPGLDVSAAKEVSRRRPRAARRTLQELADEAQRLWRAGDLAGAQTALLEVVRRGGRTARVELAYADLFSLVRQRGDARGRKRVYRSYLRRFPRGKLAEDATAGLCRTQSGQEAAECWAGYLKRYPAGDYRAEAEVGR